MASNDSKRKSSRNARTTNRLSELRLRGVVLNQQQVARLIGCDDATVSRDESGGRALTKDRIEAYAKLYNVPTHELFFIAPTDEPQAAAK